MAKSCSTNSKTFIPAQTLFLGASVADFNVNMGWGGQSSQLTVTLVEDANPVCGTGSDGSTGPPKPQIVVNGGSFDEDNHYHTCDSDETCYMDENGKPFNPNGTPPSQERIVPGKVYYAWNNQKGFVSKYWRKQDPGFFGTKSSISIGGTYNINSYKTSKGMDIINTPVFFKMGEFTFSGIVQSWEQDISSGGLTYRVNIESVDSLLSNSYMILGGYAGSIFSKFQGAAYGGPKNYTGSGLEYNGKIAEGNLANVFNVYGFLESMGLDSFGASYRNENGISARSVIDALLVLTSSLSTTTDPAFPLIKERKRAFSPFGRMVLKTAQENTTYTRMSTSHAYSMGLIPPTKDTDQIERSFFSLDLSEIPLPPNDYRISDDVLSIMDFVSNVCEATGVDFYFDMLVVKHDNKPFNVIKLRTVNRRTQPAPGQITSTMASFAQNGFPMSAANIGKEKSDSAPRVLYIGGKQQRLYQAKSYRLGFARSNYVWNPVTKLFVDFTSYDFGKIRVPCAFSTRNTALSNTVNGSVFTSFFDTDEAIKKEITKLEFGASDTDWSDSNLSGEALSGNYNKTVSITRKNTSTFNRFFPLFQDVICPFFGYQMGEIIPANTSTTENNDFRIVRPVYLDTWTGQIVFILTISDLPTNLNVPLTSLYGNNQLIITETEMRAAMAGIDSYMSYGLGKIFKPDLILMLTAAYSSRGIAMTGVGEDSQGFLKFPSASEAFNAANEMGAPGPATPQPTSTDVNFDLFLNPNLYKDLHTLVKLIGDIGSTYYGKQYLVRVPELVAYRDYQYSNFQITVGSQTISVFKGSGKIQYNYEPINEGAWEEPGNIIDDTILVGSPKYYVLCEEDGKIGPILGYNVSDAFDYVSRGLCGLSVISQAAYYTQGTPPPPSQGGDKWRNGSLRYDLKVLVDAAKAGACDDSKFYFMSLDVSSLGADDYVVVDSPVALKGPYTPPDINPLNKSKKLYVKASSMGEDIVYLKPRTLEEPRVLVTTGGLELATTSYSYQTDPNRTVVANIAIEDLLIYLKYVPPGGGDNNFIRFMAHYMSPMFGNDTLLVGGSTTSNSVQHAMLAPKAAHPYFAGIPIKSNQYTYGPWTNYPNVIKNDIFPGIVGEAASRAVENLIAGVKVEVQQDYVPWNYGGVSLLDSVVLGQIQANSSYQQITETARIDTIGLPTLGLGSPFVYSSREELPEGSIRVNSQVFTPRAVDLPYVQKRYDPAKDPLKDIPIIGEVVIAPNIPTRPQITTALSYKIVVLDSEYINSFAPIVSTIQCSISPQQVRTTYAFRTHTRKLGLFNKENADRLRKFASENMKRNKELATQTNKLTNRISKERQETLNSIKENLSPYSSKNLNSGLYGTSPTEVMCGRAFPFLTMPGRKQKELSVLRELIKGTKKKPGSNEKNTGGATPVPFKLTMPYGKDPGENLDEKNLYEATGTADKEFVDSDNPARTSLRNSRWSTYVGIYQSKEVAADLVPEYSVKSAMSLDGIFSPVSFYPTKFSSTYPLQKYKRHECPYCNQSGLIKESVYTNNVGITTVDYQCPYCVNNKAGLSTTATTTASAQSLEILPPYIVTNRKDINVITELGSSSSVSSASSTSSSTTSSSSGQEIAINLVSLQPIVVPYGEFRNFNAGSKDKCRHSIEVVAHGETPPQKGWSINTRCNMGRFIKPDGNMQDNNTENGSGYNADYFHKDILNADPAKKEQLTNQRFFGLRGPIVYHAWGYDLEGYPVPNAADEPKLVDGYGNPKRFLIKETIDKASPVKFKELKNKELFALVVGYNDGLRVRKQSHYKVPNMSITKNDNTIFQITDDTLVYKCKIENDMTLDGSFTGDSLGDVISKTQTFEGGKWTEKKKLKEFYRNWAEHPNLWKVGPIDLRWDENRQVWTTKSSDTMTIYKMVYVTLEEDLTKSKDYDETYPARGFLDDLEYSTEKLPAGSRRLVFIKDRGGYTAPRGAKLLCRYDKDSGFYEPVSKQTFVVGGIISYGNSAMIEMSYIQGTKSGEQIPTSNITYIDPFEFNAQPGKKGLFTFINGIWTLTAAKSN